MSFTSAYLLSDLNNLRVRLDIKRLIDQSNVLKNQSAQNNINEIFFVFQLISHNQIYSPKKYSKIYPRKLELNEAILFDWNYENLSSDSRIAITIWSSAKKWEAKRPLGSTVISIFDENDCLRQGKYHLFVWPDTLPDYQWPSTTSGLTDDPNIQTLNFVADKKENMIRRNIHDQRTEQALNIKLYYTYRLIPAAFLEVQFPKFPYPVLYQDKLSNDSQQLYNKALSSTSQTDFNDCFQVYDPDYQANRLDPLEQTFYFLKRENQVNPQKLLPNREEMKIIDAIVNRTFKPDNLKPQQKEMFVKYRYYLSKDKRYLIHYLHSVQWGTHEETEALKLIQIWDKIDWPDALHLLSKQFAANSIFNKKKSQAHNTMKLIRDYATQIISGVSQQIFKSILLQLIQTLRYDMNGDSAMSRLIIQKSLVIDQVAIFTYWFLNTESQSVKETKSSKEQQINENIQIYIIFFKTFTEQIQEKNEKIWKIIDQQQKFITYLRELSKFIKETKSAQRQTQYKKSLGSKNWEQFGPVAYPLDIEKILKCPIIAECSIFSSAMAPFRLTFELTNGGKYAFIYKNGDDLRQDQLILGMFGLMDKLLKQVNQDYKLTPYQALACSKSDGFVQFVPKTKTFQSITLSSTLKDYLQQLIKKNPETAMQNYIFSTAGYCAITYFFMIGDRHLENLLIDEEGKIFHIDFGFILGRDPKPYPPPIKISKQMIDAMGSEENFKKFKLKCLEAYLYLRKQAKMVYNLTSLMLDSGIKDVHMEGLSKLFDKFSINLNDQEAEKYFLLVLQECKNAMFPNIADKIHIWAGYFRK